MEMTRNFTTGEGMPGIAYELALYKQFVPEIKLEEVNALIKRLITKKTWVITISAP